MKFILDTFILVAGKMVGHVVTGQNEQSHDRKWKEATPTFSFTKISERGVRIATRNVEIAIINSYLISSFAAHSLPSKFGT